MAYERAYRLLDSLRLDLQVLSSHDLVALYPDDAHTLDNPLHLSINDDIHGLYTAVISRGTCEFRSVKLVNLANNSSSSDISDMSVLNLAVFTNAQRKLGSTRLTLDLNSHRWRQANLTLRPNRYTGTGGGCARLKVAYRVKSIGAMGNVGNRIAALFEDNHNYNRAIPGTRIRTTTCVSRISRVPTTTTRRVSVTRRRVSRCDCGECTSSNGNGSRTRIRNVCDYEPNCRCDSSESCHICERARRIRVRGHDDLLASCLQAGNVRASHSHSHRRYEEDCECDEPSLRIYL